MEMWNFFRNFREWRAGYTIGARARLSKNKFVYMEIFSYLCYSLSYIYESK